METQLVQAVEIAQNPLAVQDPSLPQQALAYLEHLKQNTHESWQAAWAVFSARDDSGSNPRYSGQARLFGLNLVGDFLENRVAQTADPAGSVAYLQEAAVAYLHSEYVSGNGESGLAFIKNKLAQTLTTLLLQTYSLPPPFTLLPTLISLLRTHPAASPSTASSPAPLNPATADLVLRVLHDLSITLGSDVTLRAVRSKERLQRDAAVRDEIRAHNAAEVTGALWSALEEAFRKVGEKSAAPPSGTRPSSPREWTLNNAVEITDMATRVVGDWVSWIDISLMVTPQTVPLLFNILQSPVAPLRSAACDTFAEIISKGMKPGDKVELARVLNLTEAVGQLEASTRGADDDDEAALDFRVHLARLANTVAIEVSKVVEETTAEEATRAAADEMLSAHLPVVLRFMSDEYDDLADSVMSSITTVLGIYKKFRRRNPNAAPSAFLSPAKEEFLSSLTDVALAKMRYGGDMEWPGEDGAMGGSDDGSEDEESARFLLFRKNLQVIIAAIASIDENMLASRVQTLIAGTLSSCEAMLNGSGPHLTWQQAELALYAAHWFGDVLVGVSGQPKSGIMPTTFVTLPPAQATKLAKVKQPSDVVASAPLSILGEVAQSIFSSSISAFPHPALQSQFFEILVRYSSFFIARPQALPGVLPIFLDWRGIHHEKAGVRLRAYYLFHRFVSDCRPVMRAEFVPDLLKSMGDALVVRAQLPAVKPDEDPLEKAVSSASPFDSQLFLFETSGLLISLLGSMPERQVMLLKAIVDPLSEQLSRAVSAYGGNKADVQLVLQIHHLFLALASLSKGFPAHSAGSASTPQWMDIFRAVTEQIVVALRELKTFAVIREAARGAFARIVSTVGPVVLPYVPGLLDALMSEVTAAELLDLLSLIGLLINRYKDSILPVLEDLIPALFSRIFFFLDQEVSGTDDAMQRAELTRGYVSFISTLLNAGLEGVLCGEKSQGQLETILQSLVFYASNAEVTTQRACFSVLQRLVVSWAGNGHANGAGKAAANGSSAAAKRTPPPGFFEQFMYGSLVGLVFETTSRPSFDFADAQTQMTLAEVAGLAKAMQAARGEELSNYLTSVYFPGVQCPPQMAQEFAGNLRSLEAKDFKKYLEAFIKQSRGG